jgi:hypothetical protein
MNRVNNSRLMTIDSRAILFWMAVGLVFLVLWHRLLIGDQIPADGNTVRFFNPSWAIAKRFFFEHSSLLWDPYRNLGQPFLAHPQNQALYPLWMLFPEGDFFLHVKIFVFFHWFLLVFFTVRLVEPHFNHFSPRLLAAFVATLGGFFVNRMPNLTDISSFCWAPAILYFFKKSKPVAVGICLTLQWFSGFPPFSILTIGLLTCLAIFYDDKRDKVVVLIKSGAVFFGLGAVQWIPFLELMSLSSRPILLPPESFLEFSVGVDNLIRALVVPAVFHPIFENLSKGDPAVVGFYFGPIMTGLFLWGLRKGCTEIKAMGFLALLGLFMTLGEANGIYSHVPLINIFRFPAQWLFYPALVWPIVSAAGLAHVKSTLLKTALVVLVVVDGLSYGMFPRSLWVDRTALVYDPLGIVEKMRSSQGRFFHSPPFIRWSYTAKLKSGQDWVDFFSLKPPSMLAAEGIREVISHTSLPLKRNQAFNNALAKASFSSPLLGLSGVSYTLAFRSKPTETSPASPTQVALIANADRKSHGFLEEGGFSQVVKDIPGHFIANATGPGRFVFSESFYPGWKVKVDGKQDRIGIFQDLFQSVNIGPGSHVIEFLFHPISFWAGLFLSLMTLVLLLIRRVLFVFGRGALEQR